MNNEVFMDATRLTIKEIADALGLAHTTVSRALNDHPQTSSETKQRVREFARKMGYVANSGARNMRSGSSNIIGFIVPDVQNEFFNSVARSLANQCATSGFQLSLGISEDDPEREHKHVQALLESRAQGVMIAPCGRSLDETRLLLARVPTLQLLRFDDSLGRFGVVADDVGAIDDVTTHLINLGHRSIAFIGASLELSTGKSRLEGYKLALKSAGIGFDKKLVQVGPTKPFFGQAATKALANEMRPTAYVVASSRQLVGTLLALRELKLSIPDDVSVVCYGDPDWFELVNPPIAGVALPIVEMGNCATEMLFSLLTTSYEDRIRTGKRTLQKFKPQLMIRKSTAAIGA
jgi:DNA-binding LacI/PurR family transcriptional regulator